MSAKCLLDFLFQSHIGILVSCLILMPILSTFLILYTLTEKHKLICQLIHNILLFFLLSLNYM